jgi:alpha-D-xyloside xylohydrolase
MNDPAPMPGPVLPIGDSFLKIGVCADNIVRVGYARDPAFFARATLATAAKRCLPTPFKVTDEPDGKRVTTATLAVHIAPQGTVSFFDAQAEPGAPPILAERDMGHDLHPHLVWGEPTFTVTQQWDRARDESLYGLGQHQNDLIDISDVDLGLYQHNTEIFIPFLVSSGGYGILWDNTSFTRYGELADAVPLPNTAGLYSTSPDAEAGDVAMPAQGQTIDWTGTFVAPVSGTYQFVTYSGGGVELTVGETKVIDHWRQRWLPGEDLARVPLAAGQSVPLHLHWAMDGTTRILRLLWRPPVNNRGISFSSEVGDGIDYTFVYGPHRDLDRVVAGYRQLTGAAPLPPRAAFGL